MQKIQEARQAARRTLTLLDEAKQQLSSARNWGGIYDLLGGKFFTSLIKHDKIDKAERLLRQAQESLHLLQKKKWGGMWTLACSLRCRSPIWSGLWTLPWTTSSPIGWFRAKFKAACRI